MNLAYIALSDKVESIPFLTDGAVEWENDPLAGVLVDNGKLKRSELYQMQEVSQTRAEALGIALVKFGILSESDLAEALADLTGLSVSTAQDYAAVATAPESLPLRFLKSAFAVPLAWDDETLVLAMAEPRDLDTIHSVSVTVGRRIEPRIGLYSHIQNCLEALAARETGPETETRLRRRRPARRCLPPARTGERGADHTDRQPHPAGSDQYRRVGHPF
jgi:hypothetical protein